MGSRNSELSTVMNRSGRRSSCCHTSLDGAAESPVLGSVQRALVGVVLGRQDVQDTDPVGALGAGLFQRVGEELLTHELVDRLVQQQLERQDVSSDRTGWVGHGSAVPAQADRVPLRVGRAAAVGLGVLPLEQHQLGGAVGRAVLERGVHARAVRAADALTAAGPRRRSRSARCTRR